jgi:hypothetical protein
MMKKLTNLLLGAVTCLITTISLQAQPKINFSWKAAGPDNVSGRSRTVLVDNQNSSRIFAGSAGGGLWISENDGTSWIRANRLEAVCVNALVQDENGTLYIGTGEGINASGYAPGVKATFGVMQSGYSSYQYGITGQGIYKMISRDSFELLEATADWKEVNRMAYDEVNHILYAACDDGLQYSNDYGKTWNRAKAESGDLKLNGIDVKSEQGTVVYSEFDRTNRISKAYISTSGPDHFKSICGSGMIAENTYRIELAIAPSDANYIYASAINNTGKLHNFYVSDNQGKSFRTILPGGSTLIDMYSGNGDVNNCIGVFPKNPKHLLIGGYPFLWEAQDIQENTYYSFVKLLANYGTNAICFDPNNSDVAYIATDMGIAKCTFNNDETMISYNQRKKNLATAQINAMSIAHNGAILAGSVENGTLYISTKSNTEQTAVSLTGTGYSSESMFSVLNTNALFYATTYGQCFRQASTTSDPVDAGSWYAGMMTATSGSNKFPAWSYTIQKEKTKSHGSLSPMLIWETTNDPYATEKVTFKADKRYEIGDSVCVKSNTANYPIWCLAGEAMDTDDTTRAKSWTTIDPVQNRIFIGGGGFSSSNAVYGAPIYMAKGALNFSTPPTWYRIFFTTDTSEQVTKLCISEDGNHLYASTFSSRTGYHNIYRFSGFNTARDSATLSFGTSQGKVIAKNPSYGLDYAKIFSTNTDFITSIYVNPYNNDELIITFSSGDIEVSSNATNANDSVELALSSKIGNGLPSNSAFYTAIVLKCDADNANNKVTSDMAMIGTEVGVYYTENFNSTNPDWYEANIGIDSKVPVVQLIQQRNRTETVESHYYSKSYIGDSAIIDTTMILFEGVTNHGWIYAATYGRGVFKTDAFGQKGLNTPAKKEIAHNSGLHIFPNPANSNATVSFKLDKDAQVSVRIFDISGRNISTQHLGMRHAGDNLANIQCNKLSTGIYFIQVNAGGKTQNGKLVVTK